MLRDREEAADAAQQTFLAAHRALVAGTTPEDPGAWLATIARNECRQRIRRGMAAPLTTPLDEDLDGLGDTTYTAAVRGVATAQLRAAVAELPERQRQALLEREVRGLSYDEIARSMGTTPPAVETLLVRARRTVAHRVRVVPDLAAGWLRELFGRLSGPADAASAAALAAKGAAALVAAMTASGAAVEVQRSATAGDDGSSAAAVVRVDNSGPGSASSGQGRGRGRGRSGEGDGSGTATPVGQDSSGQGRGRGRSGDGESRDREEDRSGSSSDVDGEDADDDDGSSGSGSDDS